MTHPKKVWHLNDEKGWHVLTMEAIDAHHAVSVDPEHWSLTDPGNVEALPEASIEDGKLGGDGE